MKVFWLCFVPLFVAVDPVGMVPVFLGLTEGLDRGAIRRTAVQTVATAAGVALAFLWVGTAFFRLLGITVADFMVAGGILLFVFSLRDLLAEGAARRRSDPAALGVVPLGVPLVAGPAVLTTSVLLVNQYGFGPTALALGVNILLLGGALFFAGGILRLLGRAGARTVSKVSSLLLASLAVMIVRKGIAAFLAGGGGP
ncbi:MarC family protein [Dissulfurirhabdus thermomarina]|uniref:UPF0056 membrane protein n=1 Tax=Dissulfurirhabdus thermomarina TaxID=1765737 RepID=A0A6N9TTB1_DISTH|nr:MarC family protein [Dissulfurirhabdus thermomarina]NDY42687.1 MarC family protein [Dissulfurirhabdus thermomarina]NMX24095.1 MarC family protein [Dissulfurirhabdus thermomarina]